MIVVLVHGYKPCCWLFQIYWVKRVTDPNEDDFETPREIKRVVPGVSVLCELVGA